MREGELPETKREGKKEEHADQRKNAGNAIRYSGLGEAGKVDFQDEYEKESGNVQTDRLYSGGNEGVRCRRAVGF